MSIILKDLVQKKIIITATVLIVLGVIFGAFGAHVLKEVLSQEKLNSFETGVRYQIYHGLALMILTFLHDKEKLNIKLIYRLMLIGVLMFSFSIYLLVLKDIININIPKIFALFTPIGGVFMILAWILLFFKIIKVKV